VVRFYAESSQPIIDPLVHFGRLASGEGFHLHHVALLESLLGKMSKKYTVDYIDDRWKIVEAPYGSGQTRIAGLRTPQSNGPIKRTRA
jgi:hypothetical protein